MFEKHCSSNNRLSSTLLTSCLLAVLLASSLMFIDTFSAQPPLEPEYYVGTIGQPSRMDPARAYDAASGELLQNIYQPLIWWNDKRPITFTEGVGYNLTTADYADLEMYEGVIATENPITANGRLVVNSTGSYWRFTVNSSAMFQNWTDHLGIVHPARAITAADIVYSFIRQLVYDSPYAPTWMIMTPALGYPSFGDAYGGPYATYGNGTFKYVADEITASNDLSNWCYAVGNDVYFHFKVAWAEGVLRQIFAQTWGGIVNPDWVKEMGGWNGLFTHGASDSNMMAGWTNNYHWKPTSTRSELDTYKNPVTFPGHSSAYASFAYAACGSGPYLFTSWDTTTKTWRIDWDINYWRGWANAGAGTGKFPTAVIWKEVDDWSTRKTLFLLGEFDKITVENATMYDLLASKYNPLPGINLVYNVPWLQNRVALFTMDIAPYSPYQAYVGYPVRLDGQKEFFFNNTHIRRAFAWAFNYTEYIEGAWSDEAFIERSWWVEGLSPASYKNTNSSMPQRNLDYTEMQNELDQTIIDGYNISQTGFDVTLVYSIGNDQRKIACNLLAQAFSTLDSKYNVRVVGVDWPVYLDAQNNGYLPMYDVGWLGNFADPADFCEPYQASWGAFMVGQTTTEARPEDQDFVDAEIQVAKVEPDNDTRKEMYLDLQYKYWLDVPSFPLMQSVGRRWTRDWVQGWYFNVLLPGEYAYDLYKSLVYLYPVVDIAVTFGALNGTMYTTSLIYHGGMYLGFHNGVPHYEVPANMTFYVSIRYVAGPVMNLFVVVALKRTSTQPVYGETRYPDSATIILSLGETCNTPFFWCENGVDQVVQADYAQEGTLHNGTIYDVSIIAYAVKGIDSNSIDNTIHVMDWNASRLIGDIRSDGIVDIYDALKLSAAFNSAPISWNWNADCDLKPDLVIDIYDALLLSANFNKHVP